MAGGYNLERMMEMLVASGMSVDDAIAYLESTDPYLAWSQLLGNPSAVPTAFVPSAGSLTADTAATAGNTSTGMPFMPGLSEPSYEPPMSPTQEAIDFFANNDFAREALEDGNIGWYPLRAWELAGTGALPETLAGQLRWAADASKDYLGLIPGANSIALGSEFRPQLRGGREFWHNTSGVGQMGYYPGWIADPAQAEYLPTFERPQWPDIDSIGGQTQTFRNDLEPTPAFLPSVAQTDDIPPDLDSLIMDEILKRLMADARNADVDRTKNRTVGYPPGLLEYATDESQDARAMTADLMQSAFDRARLARMMEKLDQPPAMIRAKTQPGGLSGIDMMQAMDDRRGDEVDMRNDFIRGSVMSAPARERSVGQQKPVYGANRPVANKGQIISSQRNKGQRGEQMSSQRNSNATRLKSAATQRQSTPRPTQTYTPPPAPSRGTAAARATAPPAPQYVPQGDMKNVGRGRR